MNLSRSRGKSLRLNEILEELDRNDDDPVPESITIFPPENYNAEITDEDSGDENTVFLHNLPGSQLRAPAEINYDNSSSDSDEDYVVPLAELAKRRRLLTDNTPQPSSIRPSTPVPDFARKTISKSKQYVWQSRDNKPEFKDWNQYLTVSNKQSPLYFFGCMFDDCVIDLLVQHTNTYASQRNKVGNITSSEMKSFVGILLFSGYVIVSRRYMYWENSSDCGMPIVYNALSRDRFTFIMSHLHCCDNSNLNANDKFAKLRPLFDLLNKKFLEFAPYDENHSIDEAMVPYYGGHPCKQFIRGKPIRWGYKLWVGATRLGYVNWFQPYQGQTGVDTSPYKNLGLGASVILQYADVLQKAIDKEAPFHLFFDNFFTSIPLLDELRERGLRATGTVRENRLSKCPLPKNKELQNLDRGTFKYKSTRSEEIVVCKWNDNNAVTVASNAANVRPILKAKRFSKKAKKFILIDQPALIKVYNENMGGVDRADQNIGLYRTSIRGKKWYIPLLFQSLDMALHNAWQLYRLNGGDYDHLKFRRSVATSLLETYNTGAPRKPGRLSKSVHETSRYDNIGHIIKFRDEQLRCGVCHKNAKFFCKKCGISLHPKVCFEAYHTHNQ